MTDAMQKGWEGGKEIQNTEVKWHEKRRGIKKTRPVRRIFIRNAMSAFEISNTRQRHPKISVQASGESRKDKGKTRELYRAIKYFSTKNT